MGQSQDPRVRRTIGQHWLAVCFGIITLMFTAEAHAARCASPLPPGAGIPATTVNPVIVRVLGNTIIPVPATDGAVHAAYAAQVTNLASGPTGIVSIVPVDPLQSSQPTGRNTVFDANGRPITGKIRAFGVRPDGARDIATLAGGGSGITFFDVTYPSADAVPELIAHLVSVRLPDGSRLATLTDPVPAACEAPVRLSPPLTGHGWWNGNGCCRTVNAHRSATLPVNGDLRPPEQFAIDFVQISPTGVCCEGPVKDVRSWLFYGAPILAAAAGKVVEAVDNEPDQIPGPAKGVTPANAGGNYVLQDIGGGRWIIYAHMRPRSVAVRAGDTVSAGQKIGEVGNSGSSTGPHLHFQVMDRPSLLNAIGLPFVFDRQILEGVVVGTPAHAERDYDAGRRIQINRRGAGPREREMPAEGHVLGFHLD